MKLCGTFFILASLLLASPLLFQAVAAVDNEEVHHMVVFNDNVEEAGKTCTVEDWNQVVDTIAQASSDGDGRRRSLRSDSSNFGRRRLTCRN
jgi:hypothetical protein